VIVLLSSNEIFFAVEIPDIEQFIVNHVEVCLIHAICFCDDRKMSETFLLFCVFFVFCFFVLLCYVLCVCVVYISQITTGFR
jgi:hypothetical protein